ncbi:hypothetical protein [Chryseobacterium terrae]|uniref:Lipoprotein n=1 Tax=Chryseobacterium terrae TaxID=3163299 RepID=A0ABW8XXZ8_9FLAO
MKSKITILTLCVFSLTSVSCRCDFEEDEPRNKKTGTTQESAKK